MSIFQQIICIILFFGVAIAAKNLSVSLMTLISSTWGLPSTDPAYRSWRAYKLKPSPAVPAWAVLLEHLLWVLPLPCLATYLGDPGPALWTDLLAAHHGLAWRSLGCVWCWLLSVDLTLTYRLSPSLDPGISCLHNNNRSPEWPHRARKSSTYMLL